eukprot:SAG31_NODE_36618_length_311_cov_1.943396_1_plen_103_part_11
MCLNRYDSMDSEPIVSRLQCACPAAAQVQVIGCTDPAALNFNHAATVDDGLCFTPSIISDFRPTSCEEILNAGHSRGDADDYVIYTTGQPTTVSCDMTNGGWT